MRTVCLLGASGSIGTQTIDVMLKNQLDFDLVGFSVGQRTYKINSIIKKFPNVKYICVKDEKASKRLQKRYKEINFLYGDEGLLQLIELCESDMVVNALVGFVGLKPTLFALQRNKIVCLANKEALVVGGELVNDLLSRGNGKLYPIDSEHVALAKCLSVDSSKVEKLILTASGGAFRKLTREQLVSVTPEDALKHPTWNMGEKITIDCATMVNKCFEVIEAHYLFNYPIKKIGIQLHDESMIHSMVLYKDGTYRVDHGKPDMRIPIKYALYEGVTDFKTIHTDDFTKVGNYHFRDFTSARYPMVGYAKTVIEKKGTYGAVLNASNEEAVRAFLNHEIPFLAIESIINKCMKNHKNIVHPTLDDIVLTDKNVREKVRKIIKKGDY